MTKMSAAMLISRNDELLVKSLDSVDKQKPDSFKVYIDAVKLQDKVANVEDILSSYNVEINYHEINKNCTHHQNVVHTVHSALFESDHKWLIWNDDDDELLSGRRDIIEEHGREDIGIIYGDVYAIFQNRPPKLRRSRPTMMPRHANHILGSGQIYNTEAFRQIHDYLDHGYYWDFKIFYWMMRHDWKMCYVQKLMSIQNVNNDIPTDRLVARKSKWRNELSRLQRSRR